MFEEILRQRGVLSQEAIHKLAHRGEKAKCHSDVAEDAQKARRLQERALGK